MSPSFIDGLIDAEQFFFLEKLLDNSCILNATSRSNSSIMTLLILSPIPVILEDECFDEQSFLTREQKVRNDTKDLLSSFVCLYVYLFVFLLFVC